MEIGNRLIYNPQTGKILNGFLYERLDTGLEQVTTDELRPSEIAFIDLPYGYNENNFKEATKYHIDVAKLVDAPLSERIVITQYMEHIPTYEELQQQILMSEGVI